MQREKDENNKFQVGWICVHRLKEGGKNSTSGKLLSLRTFFIPLIFSVETPTTASSSQTQYTFYQYTLRVVLESQVKAKKATDFERDPIQAKGKKSSTEMIFEVSEGCSLFMGITKIDFNINWKNGFFSPSKTYLREEKKFRHRQFC